MRTSTPIFVLLCLLSAVAVLSGCVPAPHSDSPGWDPQIVAAAVSHQVSNEEAKAAADSEREARADATALLHGLAARYRLAQRDGTSPVDWPPLPVVLANRARPGSGGSTPDPAVVFSSLATRCVSAVAAKAGTPTYQPTLFDWLCRATILPAATADPDRIDARSIAQERLGVAVERLLSLAERCRETPTPECRQTNGLIAQIISQQPVNPLPRGFDRIAIDSAAVPEDRQID